MNYLILLTLYVLVTVITLFLQVLSDNFCKKQQNYDIVETPGTYF